MFIFILVRQTPYRAIFMRESFKLYYRDILLGTVSPTKSDFPSTSGKIEFNFDFLEKGNKKEIWDYIDYSIESTDKVMGSQREYIEFIDKEEQKHQAIIESLDWTLVSKNGDRIKILVPVFFRDQEVNFRFQ